MAGASEKAVYAAFAPSRLPDMVEDDTRAMMASSRLAETRLIEVFTR